MSLTSTNPALFHAYILLLSFLFNLSLSGESFVHQSSVHSYIRLIEALESWLEALLWKGVVGLKRPRHFVEACVMSYVSICATSLLAASVSMRKMCFCLCCLLPTVSGAKQGRRTGGVSLLNLQFPTEYLCSVCLAFSSAMHLWFNICRRRAFSPPPESGETAFLANEPCRGHLKIQPFLCQFSTNLSVFSPSFAPFQNYMLLLTISKPSSGVCRTKRMTPYWLSPVGH